MPEENLKLELFRGFADSLPMGVHIWSINDKEDVKNNNILYINQAASHSHCPNIKSGLGKKIGEVFPRIDETVVPMAFKAAIRDNKNQRVLAFVCGIDKNPENTYRVEVVPVDSDHIFVMFTNISAQEETERRLHEKIGELERMAKLMVDREKKMIELKEEMIKLKESKK